MSNIANSQSEPFLVARVSSTTGSVTGNGTVYQVVFPTILYGSASYNTSTGVFTCTVPGEYLFSAAIQLDGIQSNHTLATIQLVATSGTFQPCDYNAAAGRTSVTNMICTPCLIPVLMAHGDTAYFNLTVSGGSVNVKVGSVSRLFCTRLPQ
jgi:hypothetical protein